MRFSVGVWGGFPPPSLGGETMRVVFPPSLGGETMRVFRRSLGGLPPPQVWEVKLCRIFGGLTPPQGFAKIPPRWGGALHHPAASILSLPCLPCWPLAVLAVPTMLAALAMRLASTSTPLLKMSVSSTRNVPFFKNRAFGRYKTDNVGGTRFSPRRARSFVNVRFVDTKTYTFQNSSVSPR